MPYIDGLQLARKIRNTKSRHNFKIVMISAEENHYNNYNNLFDEIYIKPITKNKFIQIYND